MEVTSVEHEFQDICDRMKKVVEKITASLHEPEPIIDALVKEYVSLGKALEDCNRRRKRA